MSLREKAAQINFGSISTPVNSQEVRPAKTAPGVMMGQANDRRSELLKENEHLRAQAAKAQDLELRYDQTVKELKAWEDALPTLKLDPALVFPSKWANRNELSYNSKDFEQFKAEIESSDGNVQPIKVRPIVARKGEYEIVFGHRRHRACSLLGLPVLASVVELSDAELFVQMDRENRQRSDLRPYEQGMMYAQALDEGLYPSLRKMSESLGSEPGNVSKAISLARLPQAVLEAFSSPLDLQQNWASVLTQALQKNPELVLQRSKVLSETTPRPRASEIFKALVNQNDDVLKTNDPAAPIKILGSHGGEAVIAFNPKTKACKVNLTGLDASRIKALEETIRSFLS